MKLISLVFALICNLSWSSHAQVNINYGLELGGSRNGRNMSSDITIAQHFNDRNLFKTKGYTSPLLGITGMATYKLLYVGLGLNYNKIQESYYSYYENGFYYNENGATTVKRSTTETYHQMGFQKLNIPLELGIQLCPKRKLNPILFAGVNINYLLDGQLTRISTHVNPFMQEETVNHLSIEALDELDDYALATRKRPLQLILGGGIQIAHRCMIKASYRSGNNLSLMQVNYPNNWIDCFINMYSIKNREKTISLVWLLGKKR